MTQLNRTMFLEFKLATTEVALPGKGTVIVRELRASEMAEFHKRNATSTGDAVGYMIATSVEDGAGNPMFTAADIPSLAALPNSASDPIVAACIGMSQPQVTAAGKSTPAGT